MSNIEIEQLFTKIDRATNLIKQHMDEPYLDSLAIVFEWLLFKEPFSDDELFHHKFAATLEEINLDNISDDQRNKLFELLILKGMKNSTQSQHLITPETIGLFVSYLVNKLVHKKNHVRIFDPVCGTANLLTTVLGQLTSSYKAFGSEIDPTLIRLGVNNANLHRMEIEFFHQDSLRPFLLDPVDIIVADLPVGYYPDDVVAANYELKAPEGNSYAHHLLIEQSLKYTNEEGYLVLLIPEFLFDSDQSDQLNTFIHEHAHIIGVIRLPEDAFQSEKHVKSIFILQKKGAKTSGPNQPLLAMLPSLTNTEGMESILAQINEWFSSNIEKNTI